MDTEYLVISLLAQDYFQDAEPDKMYKSILYNIKDSETNYVDWLSVLLKVIYEINDMMFFKNVLLVQEGNAGNYRHVPTNSQ